jgi:hypothetical protein
MTVVKEISTYKLELVGVQEVRLDIGGTETAEIGIRIMNLCWFT